jgi:hypothetical protein
MKDISHEYEILFGKPEGKRQLGTPKFGWEDNIKMDIKEVGCGDLDQIHVV